MVVSMANMAKDHNGIPFDPQPRQYPGLEGIRDMLFNLQNEASCLINASTTIRTDMLRRDSEVKKIMIERPPGGCGPAMFIATEDIVPGTLLYTDIPSIMYPSYHRKTEDGLRYEEINIRNGQGPTSWVCLGCLRNMGPVVLHWCSKCGIPLCCRECEVNGIWHQDECKCFEEMRLPIRRFLQLDWVYMDVAISRVQRLINKCKTFDTEFHSVCCLNPRVNAFIRNSKRHRDFMENLSKNTMPISLAMGSRNDVITIHAVLGALGHSFKPRRDVEFLFPTLNSFQHSCYPNTEIYIDDETFQIEIRAATHIRRFETILVDFLQEPLLSTPHRRELMTSRWCMTCFCSRCTDPSECGTFCGSGNYKTMEERDAILAGFERSQYDNLIAASSSGSNIDESRKPQAYQELRDRENAAWKLIRDIELKNRPYSASQFLSVKAEIEKLCVVHPKHHIILRLVEITLNLMNQTEDQATGNDPLIEAEETVNQYSALVLQMSDFIDAVSPPVSRIRAYIMYYRAKAQGLFLKYRARDSFKARYTAMLKNVLERMPLLIRSWKYLLKFKFPADLFLIYKIATNFIGLNPREYIAELQDLAAGTFTEMQMTKEIPGLLPRQVARTQVEEEHEQCERKQTSVNSNHSENTGQLGDYKTCPSASEDSGSSEYNTALESDSSDNEGGRESRSSDEKWFTPKRFIDKGRLNNLIIITTGEETQDSAQNEDDRSANNQGATSHAAQEIQVHQIPKIMSRSSRDNGNILVPQKKNKLKEALIRRQVEQRRLCQQQLSKQLEYASKHGGEVSFHPPGTKYRRHIAKRKDSQVANDLESDQDRKDSAGSTAEESTTNNSMTNPIPIHHNHFKSRFRKPRGQRVRDRDYYNAFVPFTFPELSTPSNVPAPLQLAAPFDTEQWTAGYHLGTAPFGFYPPVTNARPFNITVHPRPFPQHNYGPFCNIATLGHHQLQHQHYSATPFHDHLFQQYAPVPNAAAEAAALPIPESF